MVVLEPQVELQDGSIPGGIYIVFRVPQGGNFRTPGGSI